MTFNTSDKILISTYPTNTRIMKKDFTFFTFFRDENFDTKNILIYFILAHYHKFIKMLLISILDPLSSL